MILGLPDLQITDIQPQGGMMQISARYTGPNPVRTAAAPIAQQRPVCASIDPA